MSVVTIKEIMQNNKMEGNNLRLMHSIGKELRERGYRRTTRRVNGKRCRVWVKDEAVAKTLVANALGD